MSAKALPFRVKLASPCHMNWANMSGDERVRFCQSCQLHVYNLSELTRPEAEALIQRQEGKRLCVSFHQRPDGTVLTRDCPVGAARYWHKVRWSLAAGVTLLMAGMISVFGKGRSEEQEKFSHRVERQVDKVQNWFGIKRPVPMPMVAGGLCAPPPGLMGKVAAPTVTASNAPATVITGDVINPGSRSTTKANSPAPQN